VDHSVDLPTAQLDQLSSC